MAEENTNVADQGANEGETGTGDKSDTNSVDNKTAATAKEESTDQQDDGQKTDDGDKEPEDTQLTKDVKIEDEIKSEAPEKYEDFKLPDGFTMDQGALEAFNPVAKELGFSQVTAQKIIDLYSTVQQKRGEALQTRFDEEHKASIVAVKVDQETGGAGYQENMKLASSVIGKFGSKGVLEAFTSTGVGDNIDVIRMFLKIGKAIGEDSLVDKGDGGGAGAQPKTFSDLLYDKM